MSTKVLLRMLIIISVLAVVALAAQVISEKSTVASAGDEAMTNKALAGSDWIERHSPAYNAGPDYVKGHPANYYEGSDWIERHPASSNAGSDYVERRPANYYEGSDWIERHPGDGKLP